MEELTAQLQSAEANNTQLAQSLDEVKNQLQNAEHRIEIAGCEAVDFANGKCIRIWLLCLTLRK